MSDKKKRGRQALDVGSGLVATASVLLDVGATGGMLAGGKLLWDAVTAGIGRRRRKQAQAYLEYLAKALGEDDAAALAVELDQAGENEVWETIEEGFRAMMGAINETAKRCIALLVADYVVRQELPDREFRLNGKLFSDSDEAILEDLLTIARQYSEVYDHPTEALPIDSRGYSYTLLSGKSSGLREVFFHRNHNSGKAELRIESAGEPCPAGLNLALRLLDQNEFGRLQENSTPTIPGNDGMKRREHYQSLFIVDDDVSARFRRLYSYLNPVFIEPSIKK